MEIHLEKVSSLKPYEKNAKKHPAEQIKQIVDSIKEFGFNDPIAIDENNRIIEGHGRFLAAEQMGMQEVPCIRLESLTEEQKKAYILVHNKLTMNTGFDLDILEAELDAISDIDMENYGFCCSDIDWDDVGDLTDDTYEEPSHKMLECPKCHHVDRDIHFKKVEE